MWAQVNGTRLWFDVLSPEFVIEVGDRLRQRPTLIGVHGGPGIDSTALVGILEPLADTTRPVRFDQRGHGRSDRGRECDWTMETWADDLAELIGFLAVKQAVLLGTSFGARVALTCAIRHRQVVSGVICAYGGGRLDEDATVEAFRRLGGDRAAHAAAGDPKDPEASFEEWLRVCWPLVSRSASGADKLARLQEISIRSPDVHAAHMGKNLERRPVPGLAEVRCPVLVIGGREDPLSTPAVLMELAESLAVRTRVEVALIEDAGHPVFFDQPEAAYSAVRRFLESVRQ